MVITFYIVFLDNRIKQKDYQRKLIFDDIKIRYLN